MATNYPTNVSDSVKKLFQTNVIDKQTAEDFTRNGADRTISAPNLDDVEYDPVFTYIVLDKSGSMDTCKSGVVQAQNAMIEALRGSAITRHGAHYISQYLFDTELRTLHKLEALASRAGNDNVELLTANTYNPAGRTDLYRTLYTILQDMLAILSSSHDQGANPKFTIVLVSDGRDTESNANPDQIRNLIKKLENQGILKTSIVIGLLNKNFSEKDLEDLRQTLGFEQSLVCDQSSPRKIREVFVMASQSAVARVQQ